MHTLANKLALWWWILIDADINLSAQISAVVFRETEEEQEKPIRPHFAGNWWCIRDIWSMTAATERTTQAQSGPLVPWLRWELGQAWMGQRGKMVGLVGCNTPAMTRPHGNAKLDRNWHNDMHTKPVVTITRNEPIARMIVILWKYAWSKWILKWSSCLKMQGQTVPISSTSYLEG